MKMMDDNLKRQIYELVTAERAYPPTVREIKDALGIRSSPTVWLYLTALKNDGLITFEEGKSRTIRGIR